ncbi:MAG: 50S ribosomal protein L22 [Candidatus Moranbacteria bacterium]|nr:50S ribosomal protein L22 [Candidatus Moranbacteria bacterium]
MQIKASLKNYRRSARKVREIANVLRGMDIENAVSQLTVWKKGSCLDILNLLKSAIANAQNNFKLKEDDLYIAEIKVNEGATLKRWRARAHGRAFQILKRTCHVELTLEEKEKAEKTVSKKKSETKAKTQKKTKKVEKKAGKKVDSKKEDK